MDSIYYTADTTMAVRLYRVDSMAFPYVSARIRYLPQVVRDAEPSIWPAVMLTALTIGVCLAIWRGSRVETITYDEACDD